MLLLKKTKIWIVMTACLGWFVATPASADSNLDGVLQRFSDQLQSQDLSEQDLAAVQSILAQEDPSAALTEALVMLYPAYELALEKADADDLSVAIESLQPFTKSTDSFLAANASFYLARTLMNGQEFEDSLPLLKKITGDLADFSAHQASAQYYIGVAEAGLLSNKKAIESFTAFLQLNPNAAERLRVSAWRQIQELQAIEPGKLVDIRQRMDFSRRRLELTETNQSTQAQQQKIVDLLAKLIKEEEKKECSNSKGGT